MTDRPTDETAIRSLVAAITAGDAELTAALLVDDPHLATARLSGNDRSMLHHATDWPGHRPNVATMIALLIDAGADPDATFPNPSPEVAETPLHWAASSDDVAAVDALVDRGARVDPLGGVFGGCTPFEEAIIFENYGAAARLLELGAANYLPGAAALGRLDLVAEFFDDDGQLRTDIGMLPHWTTMPDAQVLLDRAFQFACRAGQLDTARFLLERGADISSVTPVDTTALDEASGNGHDHVVAWLVTLPGSEPPNPPG